MSLKNIIKVALLDMGGVLRIGTRAICGATNVFSYLKSLHIQPMIITNECRYTNKQIKKDLKKMILNANFDRNLFVFGRRI